MAALEIEQATKLAHALVAYQESEQADIKAQENKFDALWQSIYDVCALVHAGILDDFLSEEEYEAGIAWLKEYQQLTKNYQEKEIEL